MRAGGFAMRWIWVLPVLALGCSARTSAVVPAAASLPSPVRLVLDNGLRLVFQEHRGSDVVALHLWVAAGGRDESPAQLGFSHFVEHMLFKGTERRGPGFVDREVESVGGRTNAGTSLDYTFYYVLLPADQVTRGLDLLADMVFNSVLDQKEMDREREVIFEEVRLGEDNARLSMVRQLYSLVFDGHPYGRPVLGSDTAMKAATRQALRAYYKRHYVPENMTLVVVGAVKLEEIEPTVRRVFGSVPATGFRRAPVPSPPALSGVRRVEVKRPEKQAWLGLGWAAPPLDHPDSMAVDLLASILGSSRTSRLYQSVRERQRLAASIRASYTALQGGGVFVVNAQLEPEDLDRAERAILDEIRRIQVEGVSEAERQRALTAAESERAFGIEAAEGLAYAYGHAEAVWRLEAELQYLDHLRAVTRKQVQRAARRYLDPERYVRLALVPQASAAGHSSPAARARARFSRPVSGGGAGGASRAAR